VNADPDGRGAKRAPPVPLPVRSAAALRTSRTVADQPSSPSSSSMIACRLTAIALHDSRKAAGAGLVRGLAVQADHFHRAGDRR
jgi:hypothetical protein